MSRRSEFWVLNIRQDNWNYCASGPPNTSRYKQENVGCPWFGRAAKSEPSLHRGDLVFARRTTRAREGTTGDKPHGVMAIWRYSGKERVRSTDSLPWTGGPYHWLFYLKEVESFSDPYQEDYTNLPFSNRALQASAIGLRPEHARGYIQELVEGDFVSIDTMMRVNDSISPISHEYTDTERPPVKSNSAETKRYTSVVDRRLRDAKIVKELKDSCSNKCQICGERRLREPHAGYSEVHHIMPLGKSHIGPDVKQNMVVLCPNHHVDFDNGVISVDPDTYEITHLFETNIDGEKLNTRNKNRIGKEYLQYHNNNISMV